MVLAIIMSVPENVWDDICHNFYDYNDSCDNIHHRVMIDDIDW